MAVNHEKNVNVGTDGNKAGTNTKNQTGQNQQFRPQQSRNETVLGLSSKLAAFGGGGEQYDKLYLGLEERIKLVNNIAKEGEAKFNIHKLIKGQAGLNYSAIVLSSEVGDLTVCHILMLEKTGDYPTPLVENINGQRFDILRTPAEALDSKYTSQAQKLVGTYYNVNPASVVVVDGVLIPNEFNVESEAYVHDIFINAINALIAETCIRNRTYTGIDINQIVTDNRFGKFLVNMYFNPSDTHITNEVGMPIRQDVCIVLSYKSGNNTNDRSINQGDDTQEIVKTYGYIDFQWIGPSNVGYVQNTQKFVPNFIITRIESSVIPTPDITLLAITSVLAICEDMNWMQAFRSVPGKKGEVDFNDIGALNLEGNIEANTQGFGAKVDTKSKEFTLTMLNTLVNQLVTPNIVISIDVAQASPDTWFENVFYYASRGDTDGANNRIIDSIKNMTCGILDINPNISIFSPIVNKIHGGYYKTKDGIKDLRQLTSYLGVANFAAATGQDPKIVSEYTNSFFMTSVPTDLRATERKKFIDNMSNNTAVYKQYYTRLTFNAGFISAMLESLRRVGFAPVFGNLMTSNDMFYRRATGDFSSSIIGSDVRIISNTQNYNGSYQPNMYNRQY